MMTFVEVYSDDHLKIKVLNEIELTDMLRDLVYNQQDPVMQIHQYS